jgi:hypothetical protein
MTPDESGTIDVMHADLTEGERRLLREGLAQWGGPARPTNELAVALGFADLSDFDDQRDRLSDSLAKGETLSSLDATRALAATEMCLRATSSVLESSGRQSRDSPTQKPSQFCVSCSGSSSPNTARFLRRVSEPRLRRRSAMAPDADGAKFV